MRLFIAEKPSVAKAIATELGIKKRDKSSYTCGSDTVTYCIGHMLELAEPDEYTPDDVPTNGKGQKIWRVDELPIIPQRWKLLPKTDTKAQLTVIRNLLKKADAVVNAGDPDREGQLLVDELLELYQFKGTVLRYWSSAVDAVSVKRALSGLQPNIQYRGWADAARGRQRADWLVGMNLSRAYTLRAKRGGMLATLTIGRVQTPTLALVVERDRQIEAFKPIPFHTIHATFDTPNGSFAAKWSPRDEQPGLDPQGRLVDTAVADQLISAFDNQPAAVLSCDRIPKKKQHPLTFSNSDITLLASNKYGYSAEEVLNTCQSLYETHKLTSYPRTDCAYLPESQHSDAPEILAAIRSNLPGASVEGADPSIRSKTWNDKKISAHHGIIPTRQEMDLSLLTEKESNIYNLIVSAYLAQFYPLHEYMQTTISLQIGEQIFTASGNVITVNGWRDVYQNQKEDKEDQQSLPMLAPGDSVLCSQASRKDAKTKPPARFTDGTLMIAMENIHKFTSDPKIKKILRDGDGIGMPSTRSKIISELQRRGYLELKGKKLISTPFGRSMIDALPEVVKSPALTALYERLLSAIEQEEKSLEDFVPGQIQFVSEQVKNANNGSIILQGTERIEISDVHHCTHCGSGLVRKRSRKSKKGGGFFWGCSNYPACDGIFPDAKGKPLFKK